MFKSFEFVFVSFSRVRDKIVGYVRLKNEKFDFIITLTLKM